MSPAQRNLQASSDHGITVLVVALVSTSELSGVPRHATNLARCLLLREEVAAVHMVIGSWQSSALRSVLPVDDVRLIIHEISEGSRAFERNLWFFNRLPLLAKRLDADIVHLTYPMPVKRGMYRCPVVVTLHDLYPYDIPSNFGFPKVIFNRMILQHCLRSVDAIACVSESTLERLDIIAPMLALQKASVIYNSVDDVAIGVVSRPPAAWQLDPFLLCVAQHRRNKNVVLAMEIFERLLYAGDLTGETRLIIVGNEGPETARIHRLIRRSGLSGKVVLLRGLSDAELGWCYAHCELLLAPSSIEGFGYPILEAMLHHCRVVCSDIPAFREVGGSYCNYAALQPDPHGAFVTAARAALNRHTFRAASTERYSHRPISEAYLRLYTMLLDAERKDGEANTRAGVTAFAGGLRD